MLQEAVPLYAQVLNLFVHAFEPMLRTAYGQFVVDNLFDQIFLEHSLEFLSCVFLRKFPLAECPVEWVIDGIDSVAGPLFAEPALEQPSSPLVECLGDNLEIGVAEEQTHNRSVHLALLLLTLLCQVLTDVLLRVTLRSQKSLQRLDMTTHFVPLQYYFSLSL